MQCSYCSNKFDPFLDLSLEIPKADSLYKALSHFTAKEQLDGGAREYHCEQCRQKVKALKQLTIHKAPEVLAVHLKRFSSLAPGQKIDRRVAFEPTLDLKPFVTGPYVSSIFVLVSCLCYFVFIVLLLVPCSCSSVSSSCLGFVCLETSFQYICLSLSPPSEVVSSLFCTHYPLFPIVFIFQGGFGLLFHHIFFSGQPLRSMTCVPFLKTVFFGVLLVISYNLPLICSEL